MAEAALVAPVPSAKNSVLVRMAERFGVDARKLHATLKATAFRGDVSDDQFMALMIVADQYKLNPLTKEIYAFPDKNSGIVPVVGVDGWARIINEHPQFDGIEFLEAPIPIDQPDVPAWIECVIYRKDRQHATRVREYMSECKRSTGPWGSHPRRMLRHKSLIQCARLAFGFVGIYDQDEAERIIEGSATTHVEPSSNVAALNAEIASARPTKPEPKPAAPLPDELVGWTFPEVAQAITAAGNAKDADALARARDLIRGITDERERAELDVLAREVAKEFERK